MEFDDLIRCRESIRNYDPEKTVPKEIIEKILEAGRLAPSACNLQPWKFLVIESPEMLQKVRACYHREWFREAPLILVVKGDRDKSWIRSFDGYNSIETDLAIALTHIILAAENFGVGTCFIEAYDPSLLRKALELENNEVVFGITPIGYQKEVFEKKGNKTRKPLAEIVKYM